MLKKMLAWCVRVTLGKTHEPAAMKEPRIVRN